MAEVRTDSVYVPVLVGDAMKEGTLKIDWDVAHGSVAQMTLKWGPKEDEETVMTVKCDDLDKLSWWIQLHT